MSESEAYVCRDCGSTLQANGFIYGICPGCGGSNPITRTEYENTQERQPAPAEHAPRKYAAFSGSGEYVVAEENNPEAWVCVDVDASKSGISEVRE